MLSLLYKFVLYESKEFSKEALNEHPQPAADERWPKILLARDYEEAMDLYQKYGDNMLGLFPT